MKVGLFLVIAFGTSWAIFAGYHQLGGFDGQPLLALPFLSAAMMGPALAAVICTLIFDRARWGASLGFSGLSWTKVMTWALLGWAMALVLVILGLVLSGVFSPEGFGDPRAIMQAQLENLAPQEPLPMNITTLLILQLVVGVPVGLIFNTFFLTISEELGWRGWLQPRLMGLGFWPMCLISGIIWGLWHTPIIAMGYNYPGLGLWGVGAMVVFTTLLTPYVALARERGGVWAAGAFHGAINALAGLSVLFLAANTWPWNGLLGVGGFGVMALGLPLIWFYRRAKPVSGVA